MQPKFKMTREQNLFVARKYISDYVYGLAKLEGIHVTFPQTDAIVNHGIVDKGLKIEDAIKINNLKRAWQFLLTTSDRATDFDYLCRINMIVGADGSIDGAGKIRAYDVRISGTKWQPQLPFEFDVRNEMVNILQIESPTERSITLMLWAKRRQVFMDGNKRTALIIANKEMIENGCGIISVSEENIFKYRDLLVEFYETNNMEKIKKFVYENCIDGIAFNSNSN